MSNVKSNALQEAIAQAHVTELCDPLIGKMLSLNQYETRVYTALLRNGTSSASQIASISKVPQSKVYETVGNLTTKGFVLSIPSRPMRFQTADIDSTFGIRVKECEERIKTLKAMLRAIKRSIPAKSAGPQDLFVGQGEDLYRKKALEMLRRSDCARMVTARLVRNPELEEAMTRLKSRAKIITREAEASPSQRYYRRIAKVRKRSQPVAEFVATRDEVLLVTNAETTAFLKTASRPMVEAVNRYFEQMWGSWRPLSRKGAPTAPEGRR